MSSHCDGGVIFTWALYCQPDDQIWHCSTDKTQLASVTCPQSPHVSNSSPTIITTVTEHSRSGTYMRCMNYTDLIPMANCEVDAIMILTLRLKKLRHTEFRSLPQGHTASNGRTGIQTQIIQCQRACSLTTLCFQNAGGRLFTEIICSNIFKVYYFENYLVINNELHKM